MKKKRIKGHKEKFWAGLSYEANRRLCHYDHFNYTKNLDGDIVECGVAKGQTLIFIKKLQEINRDKRLILALDSFEGFPKGSEFDADWFNNTHKPKPALADYTIQYVTKFLLDNNLSEEQVKSIKFIKGFIPKSFESYNFTAISLLNIDLDLYQPTKDSINFFWPFIEKGGRVMFDEYDFKNELRKWPGAKKAIDEFCLEKKITLERHFSGRVYLEK